MHHAVVDLVHHGIFQGGVVEHHQVRTEHVRLFGAQAFFRGFDDVVKLRFGFRYGLAEFFNFRFAFGSVFQQRFVDNDFFLFQYKCFPDCNTGRRNNTFHSWHLLSDYCNSEKNFSTQMSNGGLGYTTPAAHSFEIILPGCPTDR